MTPDRWTKVKEILGAAWERGAGERNEFLERACAGDSALRAEIEALLNSDEHAGAFLARTPQHYATAAAFVRTAFDASADNPSDENFDATGKRIGRYTIMRLIGRGGMGTVYHAVREDDFRMEVAIKLLRRGTETEAALNRFRVERQILAGLQHPNIARLIDGGTTDDGLPFLVMEYIDGAPLLRYAAPLSIRERVTLFLAICGAVHYAHQQSIVHRDLKPANILVTRDGIPKLLDFGIAKLAGPAQPDTSVTATAARLMTPGYASPEHVRGEPVTPAGDVYSLGAVLYELLTGRLPFSTDGEFPAAIHREPRPPSVLAKRVDRDLDTVVLMALRQEPERRYASAQQFSDDLERYLKNVPVRARRESALYRGRKFAIRNLRLIGAGAAGGLLVLAAVAGFSRWEASTTPRPATLRKSLPPGASSSGAWDRLRIERIATLGEPAPGGGVFTRDFEPWSINRRGDIAFVSETSAGNTEGVFLASSNPAFSVLPIARVGQPAPGGGIFDGGAVSHASINDSGDAAFVFGLKPFIPPGLRGFVRAGLYRYSSAGGTLAPVVVPGFTLAPGFGVFQSTSQHASLNNAGDIAFTGVIRASAGLRSTPGLGTGIFIADHNGRIVSVVASGDPAPGGGQFDFVQNPWLNDRGDVAFGAHVRGEECVGIQTIGPACGESVYVKSAATGVIQSIAHQGEQAVGGGLYRWAWGPVLNSRGDIAYIGELLPPAGMTQARGIYLHSSQGTLPIALPGDATPDGRKIVTVNPASTAGNYALNNHGEVSFNAALENGESAVYVHSRGALHFVAGSNTAIPGVGVISSVANGMVGGGILNDSGQILFGATLTDGTGVLLLATPPPRR